MGKYLITVDMEKCAAPGRCELACLRVCPIKVLGHRPLDPTQPQGSILIQATHPLLCNGCGQCTESCDYGAISIGPAASNA